MKTVFYKICSSYGEYISRDDFSRYQKEGGITYQHQECLEHIQEIRNNPSHPHHYSILNIISVTTETLLQSVYTP